MRAAAPSSNSRRRRAKFRKQRFLSLSRELASTPPSQIAEAPALRPKPRSKPRFPKRRHQGAGTAVTRDPVVPDQQLDDLYPLHSEDQQLQEEDDRHAAAFFDSDDYGSATLTSLLGAVKGPDPGDSETADDSFSVPGAPHSPASSSPGYGAAASVASHDLARAVLRGRERWVLCQQQQEEDQEEGEGSSCAGDHRSLWAPAKPIAQRTQLCFLKLDYDEVLSSWSGARSVYVEGEAPQVVPGHYHHTNYLLEQPAVYVELRGRGGSGTPGSDSCGSNLWVVPEDSSVGGREARVMRYRVKRQNRLFAKRIRYEVRKLNAQKRPRIKGRFVKKIQEQASPP